MGKYTVSAACDHKLCEHAADRRPLRDESGDDQDDRSTVAGYDTDGLKP